MTSVRVKKDAPNGRFRALLPFILIGTLSWRLKRFKIGSGTSLSIILNVFLIGIKILVYLVSMDNRQPTCILAQH